VRVAETEQHADVRLLIKIDKAHLAMLGSGTLGILTFARRKVNI
jgi:hypothetical protein